MNTMKIKQGYETPELIWLFLESEGILCSSAGTNEGVQFEDWN